MFRENEYTRNIKKLHLIKIIHVKTNPHENYHKKVFDKVFYLENINRKLLVFNPLFLYRSIASEVV